MPGNRFSALKARIDVVVGDIVDLQVDAIVNAANEMLLAGGGVCGAIFRAAGPGLAKECAALAPCPTGQSRITSSHGLKSKYIVHAVGPVYKEGRSGEAEQLASTYAHALAQAAAKAVHSIAFPCISTGIYGYPFDEACNIALDTVASWLEKQPLPGRVIFCCFREEDARRYREALA
jgi:O-acetyl-ADP-ribose deacetylase (regulator of RNase III)